MWECVEMIILKITVSVYGFQFNQRGRYHNVKGNNDDVTDTCLYGNRYLISGGDWCDLPKNDTAGGHPLGYGQQTAQSVQGALYQLLQAQRRRGKHISICGQVHQPHPHIGNEHQFHETFIGTAHACRCLCRRLWRV